MATDTAPARVRAPASLRVLGPVVGLIALGALVRFWRIGHQSYWLDEAYTVSLVKGGFGHMISTLPSSESTPPLYYLLAWPWARVFGTGEAALRSLSAVIGTATIPIAYAAGRELFSRRTGLIAAALVAVNPYLVWYSQEARSYALLVLMAALSLVVFGRALRERSPRAFALWGAVAVLAMCTHYFAGFLLVPEAAWLLWATRARAAAYAAGALALACGALAPLALHQRASGHTAFIAGISLANRVTDLPKKVVTGELGSPLPLLGPAAGLVVVAAIAYGVLRTDGQWRRTELLLTGLAVVTALIPLALALAGADYLLPRNVIAALAPLIVAVAAGLAAPRAGAAGVVGAVALCGSALVVNAEVAYTTRLQRDDWRSAGALVRASGRSLAVVVTPGLQLPALRQYAPGLAPLPPSGAQVRAIDLVGYGRPPRFAEPKAPPGFRGVFRKRTSSYELIRYAAPRPTPVTQAELMASRLGPKPAAVAVSTHG